MNILPSTIIPFAWSKKCILTVTLYLPIKGTVKVVLPAAPAAPFQLKPYAGVPITESVEKFVIAVLKGTLIVEPLAKLK